MYLFTIGSLRRSAENDDIASNITPVSSIATVWPKDQVRIVFDGDGVLFSNAGASIPQQFGSETAHTSLSKGPMHAFALKLQEVRRALGKSNGWRVRTFLVISRIDENTQEVFSTLNDWGLEIDEIHILGGLDMTPFLRVIDPAIFFYNSIELIERAKQHIPTGHVPYDARNMPANIDTAVLSRRQTIEESAQSHIDINNNQ